MKTYPTGTKCSNWPQKQPRCERPAAVEMFAPDGRRCPGGAWCSECAEATVSEYAVKLGEQWTTTKIVIAA
jgi:hypothetical protein